MIVWDPRTIMVRSIIVVYGESIVMGMEYRPSFRQYLRSGYWWGAPVTVCVPSLILTSSLNRGDSACSRRTLIPRPITVARLQWVIVGVISTSTCDIAERSCLSVTLICGRLTTASSPRLSGCSWSEMGEIRSWKNPILVSECPHGSCLYFSVLKKKKKKRYNYR